ncbi:MAG: OpgC domain-containing protein, partial [Beijerinckiaceae bacterium]|nr:OpgC domain-containing protein [Beijerinckiaceae bacterium]
MKSPAPHAAPVAARDPRLDFFRGLGMVIILIAHIPWNSWTSWIPARFGFSDAAEMFVFCSGMASALAFGGVFVKRGWLMGTARIVHRIWQVYWAHIGSFFVVAAMVVGADLYVGEARYQQGLQLDTFFAMAPVRVLQTMSLTYLPPFFEILPMYLCILAMIPIVMALARIH